jgi:hypothetical protein
MDYKFKYYWEMVLRHMAFSQKAFDVMDRIGMLAIILVIIYSYVAILNMIANNGTYGGSLAMAVSLWGLICLLFPPLGIALIVLGFRFNVSRADIYLVVYALCALIATTLFVFIMPFWLALIGALFINRAWITGVVTAVRDYLVKRRLRDAARAHL